MRNVLFNIDLERIYCLVIVAVIATYVPIARAQQGSKSPLTRIGTYDNAFTTPAYQREALRLLVDEANVVAKELQLPEALPIGESNIVGGFICPFGFAYHDNSVGRVTTTNYDYGATIGNKFSLLVVADYDRVCTRYCHNNRLPMYQFDTNAAYETALYWLSSVKVDVAGLKRDCNASVAASPYWNGIKLGEKLRAPTFVPIYYVYWTNSANEADDVYNGLKADLEFFLPSKRILQLHVYDSKYILRKPLVFTNLAALIGAENLPSRVLTNASIMRWRMSTNPTPNWFRKN